MTYRLKLVIACLVLLSMALLGVGFNFWSASQLQGHLERSRLAHLVLEGHLQLKARTYRLFKQLADEVFSSGSIERFDDPGLRATLLQDIANLRGLIASEVALVDADELQDEMEELQTLAELEQQILDVVREFEQVRQLLAAGKQDEARDVLDHTLEMSIDETFSSSIRKAIDIEMAEVAATDEAASDLARRVQWITVGLGLASIIFTGLALNVLLTRLRAPIDALVDGTQRLSQGDLGHRIEVAGRDEFAQLAKDFNLMADQLQRNRNALTAARETLERTVKERTTELETANALLQSADSARRRLFADISHELRTPLTVIRGEAEVTLRGKEKTADEYQTTLQRIAEQARLTAGLVDDLLLFARFDAGEARMRTEAVALTEVVERVCAAAETIASDAGVRLDLQSEVESATVTGDRDRLRQALMIVVDNAVRYSRPDATVRVSIHPSPHGVCVLVADEGIGIPTDELDRVFERFYRGSGAERRHPAGMGLGLSIAKTIIDAHGGDISLTSELGGGTRVSIILPASRRVQVAG